MLEGDRRHLREILIEEKRDLLWLQVLRGGGEILDVGEEDSELFALGVNSNVLLTAENALVDLWREIVRELGRNPDEKVIGGLELLVHVLQTPIELRLLLLQQHHVISSLRQTAGRVALGCDGKVHHRDSLGVEVTRNVG